VEVGDAFSGEFEVLALVFADRDVGGAVDEDVGGLEDGVREEAVFEAVCCH